MSRSSYPIYIVTYYIKWVTTSWTDGNKLLRTDLAEGLAHGVDVPDDVVLIQFTAPLRQKNNALYFESEAEK